MSVKKVVRMGDPVLLSAAEPVVKFNTRALSRLVNNLLDTMAKHDGAGLAAPQIGVGLQVVVFGLAANPRYPEEESIPMTVLVNPRIEPLSDQVEDGWEGCLSVPGLRGLVSRYTYIRYSGFDQFGGKIEREVRGFHARVVQHECDHLDGVLYPQRMTNMRAFGFEDELERAVEAEEVDKKE
ncbi:MAG: peptide deformylase [Thiotrichaceae bacterium]|nr:peptide deformylase [Thiotrichaceae bacterium]PCI13932.1 MAG: peptide deformylase [Thiotrichales bacterium]